MTKIEIENLIEQANKAVENVLFTLKTETEKKPLILFDDKKDDFNDDEVYDYPWGYYVTKHDDYLQGVVRKVEGNEVELFQTGEEFGEIIHLELHDLPFDSCIVLLGYLAERED